MLSEKSGKAFTLAEVLITLTIIGIVATMTIPTLSQNTQRLEYVALLSKISNRIPQAATSNYVKTGVDFSGLDQNNNDSAAGKPSLESILENTFVLSETDNTNWDSNMSPMPDVSYLLVDGIQLGFVSKSASHCTGSKKPECVISIDVNGKKGPNKLSTATSDSSGEIFDQYRLYILDRFVLPYSNVENYVLSIAK